VISINIKKVGLVVLIVILMVTGAWATSAIIHANTPVRIGVLLPLREAELKEPLDWAKDTVNSQGGIGGRQVELVYKGTASGNTRQQAQELLDDNSIRIVIGPETSDDVFAFAPEFIAKQKILISPTATSGDIIRAFGRNGYIWRTTQGDTAQVKTILSILEGKGAGKVALLTENSTYGATFYDWTGFFATEYGIDLTFIREFEPGSAALDTDVADALRTNPDYIVAACFPEDAATIKRAIDRSGSRTPLFLSDAAASPVLIRTLGAAAEGLEGTSPTADPTTGFAAAYRKKFGHPPTDYAAPAYDALLIAAYTSARQDAAFFESPADSIRKVVYGNGTVTGWDAQGIRTALVEIRSSRLPWISGASGGLEYDGELGVDPLVTWYSDWVVKDGDFRTVTTISSENVSTAAKTGGESVGVSRASTTLMSPLPDTAGPSVPAGERKNFEAVIVGPSRGWTNYRHQADVLTLYSLLRDNGVDDDHIILMTYDDIPTAPENPLRGDVHNVPKGKNIRTGAAVDYAGSQVTAETFRNVLTGNKTPISPVVLASNASTDVFVYIASHGIPGGIWFGSPGEVFTTDDFTNLTTAMRKNNQYHQMFFFVDTCFGESIATGTKAPGILYLTGAARNEPSLGAVYDMDIRQWLSDEFTSNVVSAIRSDPDITFRELYPAAYRRVTGSHVRMINTGNFSLDTPVLKFLRS
jgi:ABC-type branched-subunit amino acid transport system substrate-binding protein